MVFQISREYQDTNLGGPPNYPNSGWMCYSPTLHTFHGPTLEISPNQPLDFDTSNWAPLTPCATNSFVMARPKPSSSERIPNGKIPIDPFGWSGVVFFPRLRDFPSASLFSKKPRYRVIQTSSSPTQIEVNFWKVPLPHVNFFRVFGMAISGPEGFWKVSCRTSTAANDQHTLAWKSTTNMDETSR